MKRFLTITIIFTLVHSLASGQELKMGEVYDYQVGDTFHFIDTTTLLSDFPSVFKEIVKNKYEEADTLYYELEVITDDTIVGRMMALAISDTSRPVFDTTGLQVFEILEGTHLGKRSVEYRYGYLDEKNGAVFMTDRFTAGLGNTYHLEEEESRRYAFKLVYFNSGGLSAGDPVVTKVELYRGQPTVLLDADTFSTKATVTFINAPDGMRSLDLRMINTDGKEVMHTMVYPDVPHTIIADPGLQPGIYFLVFEAGDYKFVKRITFRP